MQFNMPMTVRPAQEKISLQDPILLTGSCFTEHITQQLRQHLFRVAENPSGILFNPASIVSCLLDCLDGRVWTRDDLFENGGVWQSFDFHGRFASTDPDAALEMMNNAHEEARKFLFDAKWLILTLGSAWAYRLPDGKVAANCHKVPADHFTKRLLTQEDMLSGLDNLIHRLRHRNPGLQVIFTISPVRHLREGFIENNRSKAALISVVHHLVDKFEGLHYFPAYELVIDDLRDYRFFAEDMVHPNYLATRYVWEKFVGAMIDEPSRAIMEDINRLNAAMAHRPMHPDTAAHRSFLDSHLAMTNDLLRKHPWLELSKHIGYFSGGQDLKNI